jgi:hypothetical protein
MDVKLSVVTGGFPVTPLHCHCEERAFRDVAIFLVQVEIAASPKSKCGSSQ